MKEIRIEHLAYLLKQAKRNNQPQPIFFLGAGASRSGNIPLASEIIIQILNDYSENPFIQELPNEERTYAKLMDCLLPDQRDELLKKYIIEAKINVTHIYLAQLLKEGFVDYILTVNFDNLILRALALYNIFPSTYDMAILKDLTTTTFKEKSVVYLHGQNHGLWLLNTLEEMGKVKNTVPRIFDTIKNKRPWVFIGYSGEDPIFEHVKNLGRFNNGLYWVTYNDNSPNENVQTFLSAPNTNAFFIKGYDSDIFMLKLNNELGLGQPSIIDKPFSALKDMLYEIVDIEDKEYFMGVKERLEISKRQVSKAIKQYEFGIVGSLKDLKVNSEIDLLKKEIINLNISEEYDKKIISDMEKRAFGIPDDNLQSLLSGLYSNWGNYLSNLAKTKHGKDADDFYQQAFEKYKKAVEIKPDKHIAYYNWGTLLGKLAKTKNGKEADEMFLQSFEKFKKASEIKPDKYTYFYNWGVYLGCLAMTKCGSEAEELFHQAFEKFKKVSEIKPDAYEAYNSWGNYLGVLALSKKGKEAYELFEQAFEKYTNAIEIKPNTHEAYIRWGIDLGNLAKTYEGKEAEKLFHQAFEKFQKASEIKPDEHEAFYYWGTFTVDFAQTKTGLEMENLYVQAFTKYEKAFELGGKCYNLACLHALKENKKDAIFYLDLSLSKKEISVSFVQKDNDWKNLLDDFEFLSILKSHLPTFTLPI